MLRKAQKAAVVLTLPLILAISGCGAGDIASAVENPPAPNVEADYVPIPGDIIAVPGDIIDEIDDRRPDFVTWILTQPDLETSGYTGSIRVAKNSMILLWHGEDEILSRVLAEAQKRDIAVTVEQREMSATEVWEASMRVFDLKEKWCRVGFDLSSTGGVGLEEGFEVMGRFFGPMAADESGNVSEKAQALRDELAQELSDVVGTKVDLIEGYTYPAIGNTNTDPTTNCG